MNTFFLLMAIFLSCVMPLNAAEMESPRFRIESGSVDFTLPETPSEGSHQNNNNPDIEIYNSTGMLVKSDSQSTDSTPFRFSIGNSLLSFKDVSPNMPSTVSSLISVTGGRSIYQIFLSESNELNKLSGESIPDTLCSANRKCTPAISAPWNSISSYGFGYSLSGQNIPTDFKNGTYFRPFANIKKNSQPIAIMKASDKSDERHATITLKTIVSAVQADGTYESVINFLAVPGY